MTRSAGVLLSALLLCAAGPLQASDRELLMLFEMLRDNGTITQEQYDRLEQALYDTVAAESDPGSNVVVSVDDGLEVATYNGEFGMALSGQLAIDGAWFWEDGESLGNGTELRRARLKLDGRLFGDWEYEFGVDFADGDADIKDAYIEYVGDPSLTYTVGQFKEPFSFEEQTASRDLLFMERALPNVLVPERHLGIGLKYRGEDWGLAAGLFGEAFDDKVDAGMDEGWGLSARLFHTPLNEENSLLHLGLSTFYREPGEGEPVRFKTEPEAHMSDLEYLDTGKIKDVEYITGLGAELAYIGGPLSLSGEYIRDTLNRNGKSSLTYDGWYLGAGWFLTGESRDYRAGRGAFGGVDPREGFGAWELTARVSQLDLGEGGRERNFTLGLNWYPKPRIRLMANYVMVDNDKDADADGDADGNDDPGIFETRLQAEF